MNKNLVSWYLGVLVSWCAGVEKVFKLRYCD